MAAVRDQSFRPCGRFCVPSQNTTLMQVAHPYLPLLRQSSMRRMLQLCGCVQLVSIVPPTHQCAHMLPAERRVTRLLCMQECCQHWLQQGCCTRSCRWLCVKRRWFAALLSASGLLAQGHLPLNGCASTKHSVTVFWICHGRPASTETYAGWRVSVAPGVFEWSLISPGHTCHGQRCC